LADLFESKSSLSFCLFYPKYILQLEQEKLETRNYFGEPDVQERIILKLILRDIV